MVWALVNWTLWGIGLLVVLALAGLVGLTLMLRLVHRGR